MNVAATRLAISPPLRAGLPIAFIAALFLLSFTSRIDSFPTLHATFQSVTAALAVWYVLVLLRARASGSALGFELNIVRSHYVQALVQGSIYVYWSRHWDVIDGQFLLILAQILFAYAFDTLLSWTRGNRYRLGFGPVPIMLSSNFFLCFRDDWFYLQFAMIAVGLLGKEFIRWRKDGRLAHIFNPSAFGLFVFSVILIVTGSTEISWAAEIAVDLGLPPYMYLWIFAVGLIVQYFFHVTLVTLCAAATLYALNLLYTQLTGVYWFVDEGIPIAVFLGLHLLVTDPATSPRTTIGKALFGAGYGLGVFVLYALLGMAGAPRFYDKLLCIPLLNLSVRALDRFAGGAAKAWPGVLGRFGGVTTGPQNLAFMGVWIALFALMYGTGFLGKGHPGRDLAFWRGACLEQRHGACEKLADIYVADCNDGDAGACLRAGRAAAEGRLPVKEPLSAVRAYAQGCDLGERDACGRLAALLEPGRMQELEQACGDRDAQACFILGTAELLGLSGGALNHENAVRRFDAACNLRFANGCTVLGDAYRHGVGAAKDPAAAATAYERACELSSPLGCSNFADLLRAGEGLSRDPRRADAYRLKACRLGLANACTASGYAASTSR